ncbi:uncharacterized protein LOC132543977 [Ylistrum balloti]|uniref:uncharacterized protein LOC132543977 n=1 Tax=Ylistrum balloti TaxID=509963 RepID=UPI002905A90C|nr:uncharacterized protein LOC132543977 [Ylistrum balloti]
MDGVHPNRTLSEYLVLQENMAISGVYCLLILISSGELVRCLIVKSGSGSWETTRASCQLINSSILCDDVSDDTCNLKSGLGIPLFETFWIGAYVYATTIISYKGCKQLPDQAIRVFTPINMTLKDCIEECNNEYQNDNTRDTIGLHNDTCYCTTRNRQLSNESACKIPCSADSDVTCGGQQAMSTYEFTSVLSTQKSGRLSFTPVCGIWNNRFISCQDQRVAACKNDMNSTRTMSWLEANKWCQDSKSRLTTASISETFPANKEPWINFIKHRFIKWTDEEVPDVTTRCVSLTCDSVKCSFSSENCTKQLSGLCWNTQSDNIPRQDSSNIPTPSTSPRVAPSQPPWPTPTMKENSSFSPAIGVPQNEDNSSDGMLVYILVAIAAVVVVMFTIILVLLVCRRRKINHGRSSPKSNSQNIEEPAKPLMEQSIHEHRGSYDYVKFQPEYDKVTELTDTKNTRSGDYDRIQSFALCDTPEVDDNAPETERDSEHYDLLRTSKRPQREIDSTYDHIPAETEEDNYNVLQSQEDLNKDDIGDFMYDVTSAINGLGNYDTFKDKKNNDDVNMEYDTAESVLQSDS